jgi:hypothetical protein
MTPYSRANGRNPRYTVYRCDGGRGDPAHPHPYAVNEAALLEWARIEAAHLAIPGDRLAAGERSDERAELDERKRRVLDMFEAGHLTRDEREVRLAPIYEALERLDSESTVDVVAAIPAIDWTWPPEQLNPVLRALWERIDLGDDLRPVSANWTVPEWRASA